MSIKYDKKNFRKHSERNKELIGKSIDECGTGRSIVIDSEDEIIGGNGVYEQAKKRNIPIKFIESDGSELIAIKRTDLTSDDPRRKLLALADNATSDSSQWDNASLNKNWSIDELQEWDIKIESIDNGINDIDIPDEIGMSENFIIFCENENEIIELQSKLKTNKKKVKYSDVKGMI